MNYFNSCRLSASSHRPELLPKESLLIQQGNTGLYEGKAKLDGYQDGVLYLTSHRIIYVDNQFPVDHSVDIPLKAITSIEQYSGFLRSSPKLILYLDHVTLKNTNDTASLMMISDTDALSVQVAKRMQLAAAVGIWTCPICSHDNTLLTDKCDLCGVRTATATSKGDSVSNSANNHNSSEGITTTEASASCPTCTFINHPSMIQCEMCDTRLDSSSLSSPSSTATPLLTSVLQQSSSPISISSSISSPPSPSCSSSNAKQDHSIQLSFRKGGLAHFLAKLNIALSTKAWDQPTSPSVTTNNGNPYSNTNVERQAAEQQVRKVGIQSIQQRIEQLSTETTVTMTDAFQDLDRLMAKANEMVTLAETISTKMNKDPNDQDLSTLRGYMINLGISNPVTRGTAGSIYHQELSRELAEFLDKFYTRKENDIRPLTDIYCIFNRARGVALISPEDLYKACQQFEILKLPYRLRHLSTSPRGGAGLLVVQSTFMNDDQASTRILAHIKSHQGQLTALQLAGIEQWALAVALEQLKAAEQRGLLCRDDGPGGLVFYENLFVT